MRAINRSTAALPAFLVLLTQAPTALASDPEARTSARQREPAVVLFVQAGGYLHGNLLISPQRLSIPTPWRPQVGGAVLAPLGRNWGVLFDVGWSAVETNWKWDGAPGAGPADNFTRVRRLSLVPSAVRLWRRDRFSIYAGGGVGIERDLEASRFRRIVERDERGRPVLAEEFTAARFPNTQAALALQGGVIVSLNRRLVARSGYSYLQRYGDVRGSQGLVAGIGCRF